MKKILMIVLMVVGMIVVSCARSEGVRIGVPFKLSEKGFLCKTWEGSMNLGGARSNGEGGIVGNTFDFTIHAENPKKGDILAVLATAMDKGARVKLKYVQEFHAGLCSGETSYFITEATILE